MLSGVCIFYILKLAIIGPPAKRYLNVWWANGGLALYAVWRVYTLYGGNQISRRLISLKIFLWD